MIRLLLALPLILAYWVVLGSAACVAGLVDRSGWLGCRVGRLWGQLIVRAMGIRVEVEAPAQPPPGGAVYVVNHTSAVDIVLLFGWLPVNLRFLYKSSLTHLPFVGWSLPLNGHISVNRANPFAARRSLEKAARQLARGLGVVTFPEGTRSNDESLRRFKRGPFVLAIESQVPVVPVSLVGVRRLVGGGVRGFRPGTVRLLVHPPISTQGRTTEDAVALADAARQVVEAGCLQA